ncbi:nephrin-like [Macrobrachium rosenbergii]|uniref:nephrin-like n=1 Tax=Macrobrachium rosenbergii TaxID=79674 RepID=UPI0034D68273
MYILMSFSPDLPPDSPKRVIVKGPSVAAAGQTFTLTCITSSANPPASINWLVDGVEVATVASLVSEGEGGGWVTSSDLNYSLERSLSLAEISVECRAYNSVSDAVVKETRVISVIKPPGRPSLQVEGVGDVVAGGQLVVKCSSAGGNPHPGVTWVLNQRTPFLLLGKYQGLVRE